MHDDEATPIKRLKALTQIPSDHSPANSKGKSLVHSELSNDCCGICLSENGGGIVSRGFIDSCDHFFCFICIMEWSKVESKCPLCKRRFSTIRRPAKPSVFDSERVVRVPVRDQVHYYFGNSSVGPPDPYSEVICSVCHGKEDESLLLLCDLCDAGSHTYCAGLGMTVPDGDWFCVECQILKDERSKSEADMSSGERQSNSVNEDGCSISDIVRDPTLLAAQTLRHLSSDSCNFPQSSLASRESSISNDITDSRSQDNGGKCTTKSNARTLLRCRNLQDRIRLLRENWNGFRSGALRFSRGSGDISSHWSINHNSGESSATNQFSKCQSDSSKIAGDKGIQKAWKLLDKAKSISPVSGKPSKCLVGKLSNSESVKRTSPLEASRCESSASRRKLSNNLLPAVPSYFEGSISGRGCSPVQRELDSLKAVKSHSYFDHDNFRSDKKFTIEVPSTILNNGRDIEADGNSSCNNKGKHPKEKGKLDRICVDHRRYEEAKSGIQSLVKLNLKLLTKEEKLGFDVFKEVARTATHWVLAVCGMERTPTDSPMGKGLLCSHLSEFGQQPQKSSLMPECCRKCFYMFVKDAVNTAVLRRNTMHK